MSADVARPVLERLLDEIGDGHDEAAQVPDPHDDVGQRDLFDSSPLSLDDDHIVDADRLRDGDLESREQCGETFLCREADDDASHAG